MAVPLEHFPPVLAPGAMDLVVTGERKEAEYEWFRYSKLALPLLLLILGTAVALLGLSLWQGGTSLGTLKAGAPRGLERILKAGDLEAGLPKANRSLRIAAFIIAYVGALGALLVIYTRPPVAARKGLYFLMALILIIAGVIAWIAFGTDAGKVRNATHCNSREYGTIVPVDGSSPCRSYWSIAVATTCFDGALGFFSITAGLVLIYGAIRTGKDVVEDDFNYAAPLAKPAVGKTLRQIVLLLIAAVIASAVLLTVFTILLHSARQTHDADAIWGTREFTSLPPGWPLKNTRLRISVSAAAIILILLNLIPWRSRVVAYVFGFSLFLVAVPAVMAFSLDIKAVDEERRNLICPANWDCKFHDYIASIILDILLAVLIVIYVLWEYIYRVAFDITHASRVQY